MNGHGIAAIYRFEMARWKRTLWQSLITPVITTALYFVVFGSALGSRMTSMDGVSFGAFIVPGLTLLSVTVEPVAKDVPLILQGEIPFGEFRWERFDRVVK